MEWMGTCIVPPSTEVVRTECGGMAGIRENCQTDGVTTASLACLPNQAPATPSGAKVALSGWVRVFSNGGNSDRVVIEVFKAADLPTSESIATAQPIASFQTALTEDDVTQLRVRACPTKDVPDKPPCIVPTNDCNPPCLSRLADNPGEYCSSGMCLERQRYESRYRVEGVDADVPLIFRTRGPAGAGDMRWAPLVIVRIIAATADPVCASDDDEVCWEDAAKTTYRLDSNVLSRSDYQIIPTAAGLSSGITPGKGAVAGEVRDCTNVRLEFAQVGLAPQPTVFTYFNGNPFKTLPSNGRISEGTDGLGLYSGMNLSPGSVKVRAAGRVGGVITDLGSADVLVFADSVTVVPINAGRPVE
jgi:hypothetical protein